MIKWQKPNGKKIVTNEENATISAAIDMGWELVKEEEKPKKKKASKPKE